MTDKLLSFFLPHATAERMGQKTGKDSHDVFSCGGMVQYVKRNETPSGFFSRVKKSPAVYRSQVQVPVERLNVTIHNETALTLHREIDR